MPNVVKIEQGDDYALVGMPDRYAMKMRATESRTLVPSWLIQPVPVTHRDAQNGVVHETLLDWTPEQDVTDNDQFLILPVRIEEEGARGTEVRLSGDQLALLDYWAQSQQTAQVGIGVNK
jgi:hypothetical protein